MSRGGDVATEGRKPGAQNPGAYPWVGPNYRAWGEQPGFVYDYRYDKYFADPKQYQETYENLGVIDKPKEPPGLAQSMIPIAAGGGALILGQQLGEKGGKAIGSLFDGSSTTTNPGGSPTTAQTGQGATTPTILGQQVNGEAGTAPTNTQPGWFARNFGGESQPVYEPGGPGTEGAPAGQGGNPTYLSRGLQGAGGAYGVYSGYQQYQDGDKVGGGLTAAQGAANLAGAAGYSSGTAVAPYFGYANAAYGGYKTLGDDSMTGREKASRMGQQAALAYGDAFTFGGASALEGLLRKKAPGFMGKLDKLDQKYSPLTIAIGSILGGPSTKALQKKEWGEVAKNAQDPLTAQYAAQYLDYLKSKKPAHKSGGPGFDERAKAGVLDPTETWGAVGLFKTFGSDYLNKFTEQQRLDINRRMIEEGLFDSKKGNIEVTNPDRAKQIAAEVTGAQAAPPPPTAPAAAPPNPTILGQPVGQPPPAYQPPQNMPPKPPVYQPGMPAGQYLAADGVNTEMRDANGNVVSTTLIGVAPPNAQQGLFAIGGR